MYICCKIIKTIVFFQPEIKKAIDVLNNVCLDDPKQAIYNAYLQRIEESQGALQNARQSGIQEGSNYWKKHIENHLLTTNDVQQLLVAIGCCSSDPQEVLSLLQGVSHT